MSNARLVVAGILWFFLSVSAHAQWPQFRGEQAAGVADDMPLLAKWDVAKGEGVRWKTKIPGLAHASPIVWGKRVYVATAVPEGGETELKIGLYGAGDSADDMVEHAFQLFCLDLDEGTVLWERTAVRTVPKFARHTKATHVDSTPATDGEHVVAIFGSQGMFCYGMDGDLRWSVDLGELDVGPHNGMELHWGYASSPVIADGKVIVQADVKKDPYLAAFDIETGEEVWRVARDDTTSWATPTVIGEGEFGEIITNGCKHMGAYALKDGEELWRMAGGGGLPVPAPILSGDLILLTSNHRPLESNHPIKPVFAVKPSANGTLPLPTEEEPGEHVAWMRTRVGNYIQTPIVYGDLVYLCSTSGVVSILECETGESLGRHRLGRGEGFSASPVAGDGKLYFTSEEGDVHVVEAGEDFTILSQNKLGEICMATPAIADGTLVFRGRHHVIAIGK
jgi:outer membrane protein assembly factor BamB